MDFSKSLDEKIKIDNNLSNRYIDLDPKGYFIIKVDLEENKIILDDTGNGQGVVPYLPLNELKKSGNN